MFPYGCPTQGYYPQFETFSAMPLGTDDDDDALPTWIPDDDTTCISDVTFAWIEEDDPTLATWADEDESADPAAVVAHPWEVRPLCRTVTL
eukprot:gene9418-biopygen1243